MKSGLLAVFGLAAAATAQAQLPVSSYTQNNDELVLGFTIPSSSGDLVIDLGTATQVGVGGASVVDLNGNGNVGETAAALLAQLNSLYSTMNSLTWGVVGGHFSGTSAVYCTVPHGAATPSLGAAGNLTSAIDAVGLTIDGTGTPLNQQVVDPNAGFFQSWTEEIESPTSLWQENGTNPNSTTSGSFATGGPNYQLADLYLKTYTGSLGNTPVYQGYFTLGSDGSLTFTPAGAAQPPPPPPPTLSIVRSGNVSTVSFVSSNTATYKLFFTNSAGLTSRTTNWPSLTGTITGDGSTKSFLDTTTDANRFYRVQGY